VPRDQPLGFETDRLLAPRSASRATVQLVSGAVSIFGRLSYDPARRRVVFFPEPGAMRSGLEYLFVIRPGLAAWDGAALQSPEVRRLVVTNETVVPPAPATRPTLRGEVAPLLTRRCAIESCHRGPDAVMALDLSSAAAIHNTTVGVASRERPPSRRAVTEYSDPRWAGLLRIDPGLEPGRGEPAYSYLLYKLLGDGPIVGQRMPPPEFPPLTAEEIATVADWIARGAPDD
jgi:hypothetical protein